MVKFKDPEQQPPLNLEGPCEIRWLPTSAQGLEAMLTAIAGATHSICFEMYIFMGDALGDQFRDALLQARLRGVRVQVLIDAFGSLGLPANYWNGLMQLGGECRWFNPFRADVRYGHRNHRKLLIIDGQRAIVGGFNVAHEYYGDGVAAGWRDLGIHIHGPLTAALQQSFAALYTRADTRIPVFPLFHKRPETTVEGGSWTLLLSEPGRGHRAYKRALLRDLAQTRTVRMLCGYFVPTWRLRQALVRAARRGCRVQLIMAGQSDVEVSRMASHSLYARLLRAGVEIYEYQPQVLHAKLVIVDRAVYVGSANLDARSLNINHELTIRLTGESAATQACALFDGDLRHCHRIDPETWRASRSLLTRFLERLAYLLVSRLDPYITSLRWRTRARQVFEKNRIA